MLADLAELCSQTIAWEQMTGRDQYGKPTYAAAVTYTGRRVFKQTRVASPASLRGEGADVIAQSTIWVFGLPTIGYEDRIYVVGDTTYPPILAFERYPDETGDLFVKVFMGGAAG